VRSLQEWHQIVKEEALAEAQMEKGIRRGDGATQPSTRAATPEALAVHLPPSEIRP
jgi:hypothetical protein